MGSLVFIGKHHGDGGLRVVDDARAAHGFEIRERRCAVAVVGETLLAPSSRQP